MMTKDKAKAKAIAAQLHPDLYPMGELEPATRYILRCWDDIDKIRVKQDFILDFLLTANVPEVEIPDYMGSWYSTINCTQNDESYEIDVEATTKTLAKCMKWARSKGYKITKEYTDTTFYINVQLGDRFNTEMSFTAERQVMCRRVHVGTEVVPEKVVDKYDWECEHISFLGIDTD